MKPWIGCVILFLICIIGAIVFRFAFSDPTIGVGVGLAVFFILFYFGYRIWKFLFADRATFVI